MKRWMLNIGVACAAFAQNATMASRTPVLRGDGPAILSALQRGDVQGKRIKVGNWEILREEVEAGEWCFALYLHPQDPAHPTSCSSEGFSAALSNVGIRLPEDVALTRMRMDQMVLVLEGESRSFEAANVFLDRLQSSASGFRDVHYMTPTTLDQKTRLMHFTIQGIWGAPVVSSEAQTERVTDAGRRLLPVPLSGRPAEPNRLEDVEFSGVLKTGGKTMVLVRSRSGNVRALPVGYRFEDGEILAIDSGGVTIRRGVAGTVEVRPFKKAGPAAK